MLSPLAELIYNLVWIETVKCKFCPNKIEEARNVTHDKTHFIGEFSCRKCSEKGNIIPDQIIRINKKYIYENLRALSHVAKIE